MKSKVNFVYQMTAIESWLPLSKFSQFWYRLNFSEKKLLQDFMKGR